MHREILQSSSFQLDTVSATLQRKMHARELDWGLGDICLATSLSSIAYETER